MHDLRLVVDGTMLAGEVTGVGDDYGAKDGLFLLEEHGTKSERKKMEEGRGFHTILR